MGCNLRMGKKLPKNLADGGTDGLYNSLGETTAYVNDHWYAGRGPENFAFRVSAVPLPATGLLLIAGVGGLGALSRRKKSRFQSRLTALACDLKIAQAPGDRGLVRINALISDLQAWPLLAQLVNAFLLPNERPYHTA